MVQRCPDSLKSALTCDVPPLRDGNARVSARASLENIGGEIVELNFAIGRDDVRARLAHVHAAQHAATDTQIGTSRDSFPKVQLQTPVSRV